MTTRRDTAGRWYFRKHVRLHDGTRVRAFATPSTYGLPNTRAGADEAGRRRVDELLRGVVVKHATSGASTLTLAQFTPKFLEYSSAKNKHATVDTQRKHLRHRIIPALGDKPLRLFSFAVVEDYKHALLADGLSAKTVVNILSVLHTILELAKKRGHIDDVPEFEWPKVSKVKAFDFLHPDDELPRLLAIVDGELSSMIRIAARTGMRQGELLGLRWTDIDFDLRHVIVRNNISRNVEGTPKSGRDRLIPLSDDALAVLRNQRHLRGKYVWCDIDGNHLTPGECKHPLYRACQRAKLRRIGWHVLRHTFCSELVMRGCPLNTVRELAGHRTLAMTLRYAHLAPSSLRSAVNLLGSHGAGTIETRRK